MASDVNLPIIPDKVVDDVRKGRSVPLEAFSEAAADMRSANAAARKAPVHAGQLQAVSKATAKAMVEGTAIPGQTLPMLPRTRPVIPEPFQRNRINADRHGKTWQTAKASTVMAGDIVKGAGLIGEAWKQIRYRPRSDFVTMELLGEDRPSAVLGPGSVISGLGGVKSADLDAPVAVGTDCYFLNVGGDTHKCDQDDIVEVFRKAPEV